MKYRAHLSAAITMNRQSVRARLLLFHFFLLLFHFSLFPFTCPAAVPLRWTVETSRVQPAVFDVVHGETIELEAALQSYGKPLSMAGKTVSLFYQTNGMDTAWWTAPAQVCTGRAPTPGAATPTNILSATFTPAMDPGGATVNGFIGSTGDIYRAAFTLRFRKGPGARPNVIAQPPKILDLANTVVINPPWPTKADFAETSTNISEAIVQRDVADWAMKGLPRPSGGADTNAVRTLIDASFTGGTNAVNVALGSYVTKAITNGFVTAAITNGFVTAAITNGFVTAAITNELVRKDDIVQGYSWVRPNDWTIGYTISNISSTARSSTATFDDSYRVISNVTTSVTKGRGGVAHLDMLDPTSSEKEPIDRFFAVDQGITVDAQTGAYSTFNDGLFKIGAERKGAYRYCEIPSQMSPTTYETVSYYADDVAGTVRKAVNDAAVTILNNATFVSSNQYVDAKGVTNRYAVYRTFQPRMTRLGAGNVSPFAVSQHILASCKHYDPGIRWTGNQTFDDGQGNTAIVRKLEWVNLADWARTNGFSEAEITYAEVSDIALIRCSKATAVPDGCIPKFMNELAMKNRFGESMRGVCGWTHCQELTNAVPVVMELDNRMKYSPWYYANWKDPDTGHMGFSRADACKRLLQMGLQYRIHSGDSGKPVFINIDGDPVIMTTWAWGNGQSSYGASYVKSYNIIKAFVESYGDTLKGIEQ